MAFRWVVWLVGILCLVAGRAQFFERLGNGLRAPLGRGLFADSTGVYYLGGSAGEVDGVTSPGVIKWNGSGFEAVGCGFDWDCTPPMQGGLVNPSRDMVRWNGDLFACGGFVTSNGVPVNYIARFEGENWVALGAGMNGEVRGLKAYADGLYAAGWFTMADTVPANGLARWDGTRWHSVHDLPMIMPPQYGHNFINDMAIYQGEVYIGGVFSGDGDLEELARFNGTEWVPVGQGIRGSLAKVLHLDVHDSLLYISGAFADTGPYGHPDNPASGIVAWNGTDWVELGSGTDGASVPWVTWVDWHNDTLYAAGDYNLIGGVEAGGLAYWDGQRWCALLPGPPNWAVNSLAFFRDTLYVGGSINVIGEDTLRNTGKWVYGDHVEQCGLPVGMPEAANAVQLVVPYPVPAQDRLHWQGGPARASATVWDAVGRDVLHISAERTNGVDVHGLSRGVYTLQLQDPGGGVWRARFLKE